SSDLRGFPLWRAILRQLHQTGKQPAPTPEDLLFPGRVIGVATEPGALVIRSEHAFMRIDALAGNLILLRVSMDGRFLAPFSYGVCKDPGEWDRPDIQIEESQAALEVSAGDLALSIDRATSGLTLRTGDGHVLLQSPAGVGAHPPDGQLVWQARLSPETAFYGLGEKASALNHAGRAFELWNTDPALYDRGDDPIYMSIPFLVALKESITLGLFFDNPYRTWLELGTQNAGEVSYRATGGEFRLYLMSGTPREVMTAYTDLTGRTALPPLWALGFHQSRWSYYPDSRVQEIAHEFRTRHIPCDVIHFDIHYMDGYRCFTWDKQHFPDPISMLDELHGMGFKALSMIDPGIKVDPGYHVYDQGIERGAFISYPDGVPFTGPVWPGDCHFPDFSDPEVREWWGGLYRDLLETGVDAFWNDMNEIALITGSPHPTWVPDIVRHSREGQGAAHAEIHNQYALLMTRASRDGMRRLQPDKRPVLLTRSGWAGIQRHAMHWTGDNRSTWDHLHLSIQMVLNLGWSGVPITGPDVGGFAGGPSPELYTRWMQVGAFTPFLRVHSMISSPDQEPWAFGPETESICRDYIALRYRLLPYIYTAIWQSVRSGMPVARAMSFAFPEDKDTHSLDTQYLFGDSILVAPILEEGAVRREVYIPAGCWIDFWEDRTYEGPIRIAVDALLDRLPLFIRGGAVIPMWPVQQYVGERTIDTLTLHCYPSPSTHTSTLYEDDGISVDHTDESAHRVSLFETSRSDTSVRISRSVAAGAFEPGYRQITLIIHSLDRPPVSVELDRGDILQQEWDQETNKFSLTITTIGEFILTMVP
nr:DUF5110 domain-containing protein [Anaerolineae bacterium]